LTTEAWHFGAMPWADSTAYIINYSWVQLDQSILGVNQTYIIYCILRNTSSVRIACITARKIIRIITVQCTWFVTHDTIISVRTTITNVQVAEL